MGQVRRNRYQVSVDTNQAGKYAARIQAEFADPKWLLRVYLLVGTPERLPSELERALRYVQRHEEELWLWGSNPSDRSLLFGELLARGGLELDQRRDALRPAVTLSVRSGESFKPLALAELRRRLRARLAPPARVAPPRTAALRSSA